MKCPFEKLHFAPCLTTATQDTSHLVTQVLRWCLPALRVEAEPYHIDNIFQMFQMDSLSVSRQQMRSGTQASRRTCSQAARFSFWKVIRKLRPPQTDPRPSIFISPVAKPSDVRLSTSTTFPAVCRDIGVTATATAAAVGENKCCQPWASELPLLLLQLLVVH